MTYDDKQFLYACDWWKCLYQFEADEISDKLDQWQLSKGDLYWPLIKASMYAIIGSFSKAEDILMKNLVLVRQKLFKSQKKEYLCSIEDSCVSLLNFIKQRNFSIGTLEKSVNQGDVSWWDENEKYCLHLNTQDEIKVDGANTNFDLSTTYTTHFGTSNKCVNNRLYIIFYKMKIWRFNSKYFFIGSSPHYNLQKASVLYHLYKRKQTSNRMSVFSWQFVTIKDSKNPFYGFIIQLNP